MRGLLICVGVSLTSGRNVFHQVGLLSYADMSTDSLRALEAGTQLVIDGKADLTQVRATIPARGQLLSRMKIIGRILDTRHLNERGASPAASTAQAAAPGTKAPEATSDAFEAIMAQTQRFVTKALTLKSTPRSLQDMALALSHAIADADLS